MATNYFEPTQNAMAGLTQNLIAADQIKKQNAMAQARQQAFQNQNTLEGMRTLGASGDIQGLNALGNVNNAQLQNQQQLSIYAQRILSAPSELQPHLYDIANQQFAGGRGPAWDQGGMQRTQEYAALAPQGETKYKLVQDASGQFVRIPEQPGTPNIPTGVMGETGKGKTTVQINQGTSNKAFIEQLGKNEANRLGQYATDANNASDSRYAIQSQRAVIDQGLQTGKFQPFIQGVSAYIEGMGMNPKTFNLPDPAKGQIFDQSSFDQLLKTLAAQKGPQTEGDAARARKTFAGLGNTVEANRFILDYLDELANRTEMRANIVSDLAKTKYANNVTPVGDAEKEYRSWARKNPAVAVSKSTGLPITYSKYKQMALDNGVPEDQIDANWQKFAGVK